MIRHSVSQQTINKTTQQKTMKLHHLITLALFANGLNAQAGFTFNSGSTGADGALVVTSNQSIQLPEGGVLNYTTIDIAAGATLRFLRNSNNTPVYLLASGGVTITGTIDVSGENAPGGHLQVGSKGGPGGFDGGYPGFDGRPAGDGHGPGGGRAGMGGFSSCRGAENSAGSGSYSAAAPGPAGFNGGFSSTNKGAIYGSQLLVPLVGGSGGGGIHGLPPFIGGGGGGGAILIASSTRIDLTGTIRADGGDGQSYDSCGDGSIVHLNPGSGGAIRLVAPVVAGTGSFRAGGPIGGKVTGNWGRIRIDGIDRRFVPTNSMPPVVTGTYMVTFPPSRLDIRDVAGTSIAEGSGPVTIQLLDNAPTTQFVTVQARGFAASVPIQIAVTPQNGPRTIYPATIDNAGNDPATVQVPVGIPPNTIVTIEAWTRVP